MRPLLWLLFQTFSVKGDQPAPQIFDPDVRPEPRVIGGYPVTIEQRPYQVMLFILKDDSSVDNCGGVIFDEMTILSAAHCFHDVGSNTLLTDPKRVFGYAGKTFMSKPGPENVLFAVSQLTPHAGFNRSTGINDIAILRLSACLRFDGSYVQPIGLTPIPPSELTNVNFELTISGWGRRFKQFRDVPITETADQLKMGTLDFLDLESCRKEYRDVDPKLLYQDPKYSVSYVPLTIPDTAFCGKTTAVSPCFGDSGGPSICELPDNEFLCGIVSFSGDCALVLPSVYTDVTKFKDWMHQNSQRPVCGTGEWSANAPKNLPNWARSLFSEEPSATCDCVCKKL